MLISIFFFKSQLMKEQFHYVDFFLKWPLLTIEFHSIILSIIINIFNKKERKNGLQCWQNSFYFLLLFNVFVYKYGLQTSRHKMAKSLVYMT